MCFNIAIDGPAGAGKSTIARRIGKELGFVYVDTGAMYRAIALYFLRNRIEPEEEERIHSSCQKIDITISYVEGEQQVILNGENVNEFIRTEEIGKVASACAKNKEVRLKLVELQRNLAKTANVVMDGRDIGTYVLPLANVKIYLTAKPKVRAKRRWKELTEKGIVCNLDEIEKEIVKRDEQDMNREFAPLRQSEDAILVDSSDMKPEQVIHSILQICRKKMVTVQS